MIGFVYNGATYTYRKNLFGDVVSIYSGTSKLAEYAYDAWGNCTVVSDIGNIGAYNPFRYRGYYWDADLQLYYLMSRYYDPQTGRFINADSLEYLDPETIGGLNLYAYCGNNPIMLADPSGHSAILIGLIIGAIIGFSTAAYIDYADDGEIFNGSVAWYDYLGATIVGGAIGAGFGYIAPAIAEFAATSFTIGSGLTISAGGTAAVTAGLTITGAQVLQTLGVLAGVSIAAAIIGKSGGYTVKHYPNDHDPEHVHIFGDDIADKQHGIRIGIDGKPLSNKIKLPHGAKKALKKLWKKILEKLLK